VLRSLLMRRLYSLLFSSATATLLQFGRNNLKATLGITAVHANRVIKQLRQDGIVEFQRGRVTVLDEARFLELADFDGRYLHQSPTL